MIVCVSPNPAWDVTYQTDRLVPGASHRVRLLSRQAGGKGANVARVLRRLGDTPHVVAPGGHGESGDFTQDLHTAGVACTLTLGHGPLRTSVAVVDDCDATVLNEIGSPLTTGEWSAFVEQVDRLLPSSVVAVLTGSLPEGAPEHGYRQLTELAHAHGIPVVLDTGGTALTAALAAAPEVVKPNVAELEEHAGRRMQSLDDILDTGSALLRQGAGRVVVSRGRHGVVVLTGDTAYLAVSARDVHGNPTGAGDALTAVLARGLISRQPWADVISEAVAVAAASVSCPWAGDTDLELAAELRPQVRVQELR